MVERDEDTKDSSIASGSGSDSDSDSLISKIISSISSIFYSPISRDRKQSASHFNRMEIKAHDECDKTTLQQSIEDDRFWTMPDDELLHIVAAEFPNELDRLKNAYSVKGSGIPKPSTPSISYRLYGKDFDEVNRTLVGVLALRWIRHKDYTTFIGTQAPEAVVLTQESFTWICNIFENGLKALEDVYALLVSMVINDLGKDPNLAADFARLKNMDISHVNHDMVLYHAVEAGMVTALNRLTPEHKENMLVGIRLGAEFNFGQLAQGENAPASLSGLLKMKGHNRAFDMRFMEQLLDLSGASGHEDWTCARKMIEPIFQSYQNVYTVASGIIGGRLGLRDGYDIILKRKLELLNRAGYSDNVDIQDKEGRALLRLFCLGNTSNKEDARLYRRAFDRISPMNRQRLIRGLNVDGSVEEPAVQPTYCPAILTKAYNRTVHRTDDEHLKAISGVLNYMAKCFVIDDERRKKLPHGVTVIERDMRKVYPVIDGNEFLTNPDSLEKEDIPDDQVANMA